MTWFDLVGTIDVARVGVTSLVILHLPEWIPGQRSVIDLVLCDDSSFLLWG